MVNPDKTLVVPQDDMTKLRHGVRQYCAETKGHYDTVNLLLTLKRTVSELNGILEAYTGDVRVTPGRINVLMTLASQPANQLPLSELGDYLVVTRANITGLVDGLVKDGLVRRIDHPEDRRMILAELTDKGKRFIDWFAPRHHALMKTVGSCMADDDKRKIVVLLDELRAHIRSMQMPVIEPFSE